jgi:CelD/BcsL family acetyltransferase involved in cellulose biosynthesis
MEASAAVSRAPVGAAVPALEPARYTDPGAVAMLAPVWDRLSTSPMQHTIWAQAWLDVFGKEHRLRFFAAGAPDAPAAIAPLVARLRGPERLELLGGELHEETDVLGTDVEALDAMARDLAARKIPLLLRRVPAASPFVGAVRKAYSGRGIVLLRAMPGSPYLVLEDRCAEPEQLFCSRRRADLRRARRRADSLGEVRAEVVAPPPELLGELLEEAFSVEAASWKGENGTALAADAARGAFYRRYAEAAARRGILRLCFLRIGGRAAAMQIAVESHNRFWLLKIGYDAEFARCSPGTLLMLETVRGAAAQGLESYELLGVPEAWTRMWTSAERGSVSLRAYPAGFSGVGALALDGATLAGRELRGRVRR